jgi:hypothetical protein
MGISRQVSPVSFYYWVCPGYCHRALAGESGMIRTQAAKHNRLVTVTVQGTPCVTLPCKQ